MWFSRGLTVKHASVLIFFLPELPGVVQEAGRVGQEHRPRLQPRHAEDREERALQADDP